MTFETLELSADSKDSQSERDLLSRQMIRVFDVLKEYVKECDEAYVEERAQLSLSR